MYQNLALPDNDRPEFNWDKNRLLGQNFHLLAGCLASTGGIYCNAAAGGGLLLAPARPGSHPQWIDIDGIKKSHRALCTNLP